MAEKVLLKTAEERKIMCISNSTTEHRMELAKIRMCPLYQTLFSSNCHTFLLLRAQTQVHLVANSER